MMLLGGLLMTGCDKLDDSEDGMVKEILPGKWAFSYIIKGDKDPGFEFVFKNVIFNEDGTCAITSTESAINGTYVANNSMIRIVSNDIGSEEQVLIWRIVSLSEKQVVAEYDFSLEGSGSMTAVVTLDKQ